MPMSHNHPDHHITTRSEHDNKESAEQANEYAEEEGDIDSVNETASADNELEEFPKEVGCDEHGNKHEEKPTLEAVQTHAKLSLKDQQGEHKVGKRSASQEDHSEHGTDRHHGIREKRSESAEEDSMHSAEGVDHFEPEHEQTMEPSDRKRRNTDETHNPSDHSSHSHEEEHHVQKRSLGHGRHDHIHKRDVDEGSHNEDEPTFASDDVHQVDSVAVRVKRVSRAGSSHKPRVMHKNKGNSRAGQNEPGIEMD
ncbi:hypothetical protein GCK32_003455 [Trichostrongylus colubriformis]|uniref:Uncharacterized protein n=1 Tax=Trichostrongylus colubriformis TaxID=6319 RepID=A0AAN8FV40_TRICO